MDGIAMSRPSRFVLAVAAHLRFHDEQHLPTPLVILLLAAAVLLLRVFT